MVEAADLVIAEATHPSTGMGIELQIASQSNIPIIMLFRSKPNASRPHLRYQTSDHEEHEVQIGRAGVSLMALGIPGIVRTIEYDCPEEAVKAVQIALVE